MLTKFLPSSLVIELRLIRNNHRANADDGDIVFKRKMVPGLSVKVNWSEDRTSHVIVCVFGLKELTTSHMT